MFKICKLSRQKLFNVSIVLFALAICSQSFAQEISPLEENPLCERKAGSLPDQKRSVGATDTSIPIEHIIVIMQENHSFDNYFGALSFTGYQGLVDGLTNQSEPRLYHEQKLCIKNPVHNWDMIHQLWNNGKNDGFGANGSDSFAYYNQSELNFYYALANRFAIADRYFSSVLGPTFPNRMFFMSATADGEINDTLQFKFWFKNHKTIFDSLSKSHVTWKYYFQDIPAMALVPRSLLRNSTHLASMKEYAEDLKNNSLPSVVFLDHSLFYLNEEPPKNIQLGQQAVAQRIHDLIASSYWSSSAVFFTYDEGGGFYDHVAPPKACLPDSVKPSLKAGQYKADYDRYGFRVPFVAISPFAKTHYVSHQIYDHTSILKFIETKFNLPALSARDANADAMLDLFDFDHPNYEVQLPEAFVDPNQLKNCKSPKSINTLSE